MKQKTTSKLVFTNDQDVKAKAQSRRNRVKGEKSQESSQKIRSYDFNYSFKEFLKLALAKILPRQTTGITFIPDRNLIIGEQKFCKTLIGKSIDELANHKYVVQKINSWNDLDEVQYWLEEGAAIYRPGVIEIALRQLQKIKAFATDCEQFRSSMMRENIILLRVDQAKKEQAVAIVKQIFTKQNNLHNQKTISSFTNTYNQDSHDVTQQKQSNCSKLTSQISSDQTIKETQNIQGSETILSYAITENDESIMRDSFCIYSINKAKNANKILENID